MSTPTFRTSVAANILSCSSYTLRRLAKAGLIDAEATASGHLRIPVAEVERLQRVGLPPVPQASPDEEARNDEPPCLAQNEPARVPDPESAVVRAARDELSVAKTKVELRKVELELEQAEDCFRERDRQATAQQNAARHRQEEVAEAAARKRWTDDWLERAMRGLPLDCPPGLEETIATDVRRILSEYSQRDSVHVVERLIQSAVERSLIPHRRHQMIEAAIEEAVESLPYGAKHWSAPTAWQIQARKLAVRAVEANSADMGEKELKQIARQAVIPVVGAFEREEAIQRLLLTLQWWQLGNADQAEHLAATQAAKEALQAAAPSATTHQLEERMKLALRPHEQKVKARLERHRQEQEVQDLISSAASHLSRILLCDYKWDSFGDCLETEEELAEGLPEAIRDAAEDGDVEASTLKEFVEAWVDEQMDAEAE